MTSPRRSVAAAGGIALACSRGGPPPEAHGEPGAPGAAPTPAASAGSPAGGAPERGAERARMLEQFRARGLTEERVLAAMGRVPRHLFVPASLEADAYGDRPLPIGSGQTISQPYIVALMTEAARPGPRDRCLDVGTGSGYQAAVLAELCRETFSVELLPAVAAFGAENLRRAGAPGDTVRLRVGDGWEGWPDAAPFDVIVVTAAPERVPPPLLEQLAVGGRLVIPVGAQDAVQVLERWTRTGPGPEGVRREELTGVRFVPLVSDAGR